MTGLLQTNKGFWHKKQFAIETNQLENLLKPVEASCGFISALTSSFMVGSWNFSMNTGVSLRQAMFV